MPRDKPADIEHVDIRKAQQLRRPVLPRGKQEKTDRSRSNNNNDRQRRSSKSSRRPVDDSSLSGSSQSSSVSGNVRRKHGATKGAGGSKWTPKRGHDVNQNLVQELQKQQGEIDALKAIQEEIQVNERSQPSAKQEFLSPTDQLLNECIEQMEGPSPVKQEQDFLERDLNINWTEPDRGVSKGVKLSVGIAAASAIGSLFFGRKSLILGAAGIVGLASFDMMMVRLMQSAKGLFTVHHTITASKTTEEKHIDLRPDRQAMKPIKHEPIYMKGEYVSTHLGLPVTKVALSFPAAAVAQISVSANVALNARADVAFERMNTTANTLHTVNFDMYKSLYGQSLMQDSVLVSFGLYKQMHQRLRSFPFPSPPTI